jgi:hypothetical protein
VVGLDVDGRPDFACLLNFVGLLNCADLLDFVDLLDFADDPTFGDDPTSVGGAESRRRRGVRAGWWLATRWGSRAVWWGLSEQGSAVRGGATVGDGLGGRSWRVRVNCSISANPL